jgi:hypothetical protein
MIISKPAFRSAGTPGAQEQSRPTFSLGSFRQLIENVKARPELLRGDWRHLVASEFRLTADQVRSLSELTERQVRAVQSCFDVVAEHLGGGGTIRARVVKILSEQQSTGAVHECRIELLGLPTPGRSPRGDGAPRMLRIAHCDAHCKNWDWNSL